VPGARAVGSWIALAAALAAAGSPPAAAEGGGPAFPPPKNDPDKEFIRFDLVSLEPFPRSAPAGEVIRIKFKLKAGLRSPVLIVIYPAGPSSYIPPDVSAGNDYEVPFRLDIRGGSHRLAIVGTGPLGDRQVAEFIVKGLTKDGKEIDRDVEVPPADAVYPNLDPGEHPLRLERILFHRMNALRADQGLARLPWFEPAARSARQHILDVAKYWEESVAKKTGNGQLFHKVPGAGPDGGEGPLLADRVRFDLGWLSTKPVIPLDPPERGRGRPNYVAEILTQPKPSLDWIFEQELLHVSAMRAPLLSGFLTHAAGAATWRWYGWKKALTDDAPRPKEPPPPPPGASREAFTTLVFLQINDPAALESLERDRREVKHALGTVSNPAEKADALRRLGQEALAESPAMLEEAAKARDPVVLAAALDGLWLCAPESARRLTDPLQVRAIRALAEQEECRAAEPLRTLALVRYDAASQKAGAGGLKEVGRRARAALEEVGKAAKEGRMDEAKTLVEAARGRFAGYPEAEEIEALQRFLAKGAGAPPAK